MMFDSRSAWNTLASDYERARLAVDSLDTLIEWPAQQAMIGDVYGKTVLDVGCGSAEKVLSLLARGATHVVGIDVSDTFITPLKEKKLEATEFVQADINCLAEVEEVRDRNFDVILCFQVLGYAEDLTAVLSSLCSLLAENGRLILCSSSPLRFAVRDSPGVERVEDGRVRYASSWNPSVTLEHRSWSLSERLNSVAAAELYVARSEEPVFPPELKSV